MAKEPILNKAKNTLWSRFASWLANLLGKIGKAWNGFKSLFSSNKSKATAAESNNLTLNQSQSQGESNGAAPQQQPEAVLEIALTVESPDQTNAVEPNGEISTQSQGKGKPLPAIVLPHVPQMEVTEEVILGKDEHGNPKPEDTDARGALQKKTPLLQYKKNGSHGL